MTILIYVNTSKQVGDVDHLKVFANAKSAHCGQSSSGINFSARLCTVSRT